VANRVTTIFDLDDKGIVSGLKNIRRDVAQTDGFMNKLKVGAKGLGDTLKQNAGPAALAAGAAFVAFGVKAVGAFTDTAKAAIDMSAATGLAVEDASRWIAVGDDFGVSAEQMAAGVGKITKSLDSEKWAEYGIATRDAAGNARDANTILLDTFDMLGRVTNETERARIGAELFGKGYANLAPLIGKTRVEYEDMLGAVEKGQVITAKEAEKAERMRKAEDALSDAVSEVTLAFGEMVAELAPAIEEMADGVAKVTELTDKIGGLGKTVRWAADQLNIFDNMRSGWERMTGSNRPWYERMAGGLEELTGWIPIVGEQVSWLNRKIFDGGETMDGLTDAFTRYAVTAPDAVDITDKAANGFVALTDAQRGLTAATVATSTAFHGMSKEEWDTVDASRAASEELVDLEAAEKKAEEATDDLNDAYSRLTGKFDERDAYRNATDALGELMKLIDSGDATWDQLSEATDNATRAYADFVMASTTIPTETKTSLLVALDQGKLDAVRAFLDAVAKGFDMPIYPKLVGGAGISAKTGGQMPTLPKFADGGVMPGPRGEHNLAWVAGGETVLPTHKGPVTAGGGAVVVNVDARGAVGLSGPQVEQWVLEAWTKARRNRGKST
jgi:hypothetical protein